MYLDHCCQISYKSIVPFNILLLIFYTKRGQISRAHGAYVMHDIRMVRKKQMSEEDRIKILRVKRIWY